MLTTFSKYSMTNNHIQQNPTLNHYSIVFQEEDILLLSVGVLIYIKVSVSILLWWLRSAKEIFFDKKCF